MIVARLSWPHGIANAVIGAPMREDTGFLLSGP
jgi:hypothetical protein